MYYFAPQRNNSALKSQHAMAAGIGTVDFNFYGEVYGISPSDFNPSKNYFVQVQNNIFKLKINALYSHFIFLYYTNLYLKSFYIYLCLCFCLLLF